MATNIPPHNLGEVVDATIALIDDPELTVRRPVQASSTARTSRPAARSSASRSSATDHRREETVDAIRADVRHGRGRVVDPRPGRVRGDPRGDRTAIIVTELPYQVNKAALHEKIAELVKDKRDRRHRRPARRVRPRRHAAGHRAQARRQPAQGPQPPVQAHRDADGVQLEHAGAGRRRSRRRCRSRRSSSTSSTTAARSSGAAPSSSWRRPAPGPTSSKGLKIALDNLDAVIRTIRESADVDAARTNLMSRLRPVRAAGPGDPRHAARPPGRPRAQEDRGRVPRGHQAHRRARGHPGQPGAASWPIIKDELAELKRKYADERRTRVVDDASREITDEDLIADEDVVDHDQRPRLHQAPAGRDLPPPAPRRQGDHRPRHPRGGRGRAPARREHPRLGPVLHEPRPRVLGQGPRRSPTPAARPRASRSSTCRASRSSRARSRWRRSPCHDFTAGHVPRAGDPAGDHQEDAARAVREGPLERDPWRSPSTRTTSWPGSTSTGADDIIIATALGQDRPVPRDRGPADGPRRPAGVIGIRLARKGDAVVSMCVVQPDADLLVLTETGYGKRVALDRVPDQAPRRPGRPADRARGPQDRRRGRGPAGHRAGRGAAPDQRRRPGHPDGDQHDQPLLAQRRAGVIVMRLAEGDRVVGDRGVPGGAGGAGWHRRQ